MEKPEKTLEGWYCLHDFRSIDWPKWKLLDADTKRTYLEEFENEVSIWQQVTDAKKGAYYLFDVTGEKADLGILIMREKLDDLNEAQNRLNKLHIADYLIERRSFVSVTEVGTYTGEPKTDKGWAYVNAHLKPELPDKPYICFYPMSKSRIPNANWYTLPYDQRKAYMHDHGMIGRTYAGKIWVYITGAIGFDDDEWGVTLFAEDPLEFKKIITEMRYAEASSVYGEFPYFMVGCHLDHEKLQHLFLDTL